MLYGIEAYNYAELIATYTIGLDRHIHA